MWTMNFTVSQHSTEGKARIVMHCSGRLLSSPSGDNSWGTAGYHKSLLSTPMLGKATLLIPRSLRTSTRLPEVESRCHWHRSDFFAWRQRESWCPSWLAKLGSTSLASTSKVLVLGLLSSQAGGLSSFGTASVFVEWKQSQNSSLLLSPVQNDPGMSLATHGGWWVWGCLLLLTDQGYGSTQYLFTLQAVGENYGKGDHFCFEETSKKTSLYVVCFAVVSYSCRLHGHQGDF